MTDDATQTIQPVEPDLSIGREPETLPVPEPTIPRDDYVSPQQFPYEVLELAERHGIPAERAVQFGTVDTLLRFLETNVRSTSVSSTGGGAPEPPPPSFAFEMPEGLDENVGRGLKALADNLKTTLDGVNERIGLIERTAQQAQTSVEWGSRVDAKRQVDERESAVEKWVNSDPERFSGTFGRGTNAQVANDRAQAKMFQNRKRLYGTLVGMEDAYRLRGTPVPPRERLLHAAALAEFGDQYAPSDNGSNHSGGALTPVVRRGSKGGNVDTRTVKEQELAEIQRVMAKHRIS